MKRIILKLIGNEATPPPAPWGTPRDPARCQLPPVRDPTDIRRRATMPADDDPFATPLELEDDEPS